MGVCASNADNVGTHNAAWGGKAGGHGVQLVLAVYHGPARVGAKDKVAVPGAPRAAAGSVSCWVGRVGAPPYTAQHTPTSALQADPTKMNGR